jgi:uncharacterized iron-regulated membrane protein
MISPRLARRIASIHKWLGLIVGLQLVVWTGTGLFFAAVHITDIRGENLVHPAAHVAPMDGARIRFSSADALKAVAEDRPIEVVLRPLAGEPMYEVRGEIGTFLVSAETGERIVVDEARARALAQEKWIEQDAIVAADLLEVAPKESGLPGEAWSVRFKGEGNPTLYVSAVNGRVSAPRTDLWRTYDFLWQLHLMDWGLNENFNTPWMLAAAIFALSTALFGIALLAHRFSRGLIRKETP